MMKNKIRKFEFLILIFILLFNIFFGIGHIKTGSMEPAIKTGSFILYEKYPTSIEVGDIVLFKNGNKIICHRLIKKDELYIYTKGDANIDADPKIPIEDVKGKVLIK